MKFLRILILLIVLSSCEKENIEPIRKVNVVGIQDSIEKYTKSKTNQIQKKKKRFRIFKFKNLRFKRFKNS